MPRYYIDSGLSAALVCILGLHYAGVLAAAIDAPLLIAAAVAGTLPVFWNAYRALRKREWASMDMLASIALAFSIADQQWASAVFIALMLAAARILDELTHERTERSIKGLLKLRPSTAKVERAGTLETIALERVAVGDTVVVDLDERVPVDGEVIAGSASVDESSLTGESLPVEKPLGAKVYSSTLVVGGSIRIRAQKVGTDTTFEKIIALVETARAEKPKTQTMGERFGKVYLVAIFIASAVLFVATHNVPLVLSVVLVVCADDIAIAIPLAYLRAIGVAARRGVIVKGGLHLETLGSAAIVVFDKTGTLTKGALAVSELVAAEGVGEAQVCAAAALATGRSTHPISRAIFAYAVAHGAAAGEPDDLREEPGLGVTARTPLGALQVGRLIFLQQAGAVVPPELEQRANTAADSGKSVSYVAQGGRAIGFFAVADEIKPTAAQAIAQLKQLGVTKVVMLTGDNERVARAVAAQIGIDEVRANLLPADKVAAIKALHAEGTVAMVGDGVNDAAALSAAHVGIAMGAMGSEGAIESANIVLMRDDLLEIAHTVRLARTVRRVAVEDFWIWGATNVAGLVLVFGGVIGPSGAAAYNFISDFFPLFNSLRVRPHEKAVVQ